MSDMSCCSDEMEPIETSSCCTPKDSASDAARAMRSSGAGCAPVVENLKNMKMVGVVTERDVCCGPVADDRQASTVRVSEVMRPVSACCGLKDPVDQARQKMHENRATSVPVVDEAGGCCGIVSAHHLVSQ